jgi:hypothetical protein
VHIAVAILMLAGFAEDAAAASWRLAQPKGETITLTVTDTAIHIVARGSRIEIPVANVQSLRVSTHHLTPFEKWESWQPEGQRGRVTVLDRAGLESAPCKCYFRAELPRCLAPAD